jgi:outer membrane receptor protein involved in Fe transport
VTGQTITYAIFDRAYGQLDGSISYQVTPNFGLTAEAINLTNAVQSSYLQYANQPFTWSDSGRRFYVGGRFKF